MSSTATQKRWLTASSSPLGKIDLTVVLRKEDAWNRLPLETRQRLCSLLPATEDGSEASNPDLHPLKTSSKIFIERELRKWQDGLVDGKETKKWRAEAIQAGHDRATGKWDEVIALQREHQWAKKAHGLGFEQRDPSPEHGILTKDEAWP